MALQLTNDSVEGPDNTLAMLGITPVIEDEHLHGGEQVHLPHRPRTLGDSHDSTHPF